MPHSPPQAQGQPRFLGVLGNKTSSVTEAAQKVLRLKPNKAPRTPLSRSHTDQQEGDTHHRKCVLSVQTTRMTTPTPRSRRAQEDRASFLASPMTRFLQKRTALSYKVTPEWMGIVSAGPFALTSKCTVSSENPSLKIQKKR